MARGESLVHVVGLTGNSIQGREAKSAHCVDLQGGVPVRGLRVGEANY